MATTKGAKGEPFDMKLEVVVIPVSDVDRATEFYKKTRVEAGRHAAGVRRGPDHPAGVLVLDPLRRESHVGHARLRQGVPDRVRRRGGPQ